MNRAILLSLRNSSVSLCLIAAVFSANVLTAQTRIPGLRQIRWSLLDIVILPDSASGLLFLVAPNPRAVQWTKPETRVVSIGIDPITALQWATVARTLLADPSNGAAGAPTIAPPLQDSHRPAFVLLAKNPKKSPPDEAIIFLVSDTASHTQWKSFTSAARLDSLLTAVEAVARERQPTWSPASTSAASSAHSVDVPVEVVFQPKPTFPGTLAGKGREGRVWMSYAVDSTGRTVSGSMRPLLSDDLLFTQAAIDALMHSKFKPALRGGRPVRQQVFQVIQFRQW